MKTTKNINQLRVVIPIDLLNSTRIMSTIQSMVIEFHKTKECNMSKNVSISKNENYVKFIGITDVVNMQLLNNELNFCSIHYENIIWIDEIIINNIAKSDK